MAVQNKWVHKDGRLKLPLVSKAAHQLCILQPGHGLGGSFESTASARTPCCMANTAVAAPGSQLATRLHVLQDDLDGRQHHRGVGVLQRKAQAMIAC